jgi:putative ABC transport system permease protein
VCLVLGVAALAAIGTLTEAVRGELDRRGQAMLGGDVEVEIAGRQAFAAEQAAFARAGRLSIGARMRAMATVPARWHRRADRTQGRRSGMAALWHVHAGRWPRCRRPFRAPPGSPGRGRAAGRDDRPEPAHRQATFRIGGVIGDEPDRLGEGFALGPTVIVSRAGLDATGLVQPGAMVRWKYRLRLPALTPAQTLADALTHQFPDAGLELRTRDKASPGLDRFVSRMGQFLALVALAALLIAGIGIGNGVASYLEARRGAMPRSRSWARPGRTSRASSLATGPRHAAGDCRGPAAGPGATPLIGLALKDLLPIPAGLVLAPARWPWRPCRAADRRDFCRAAAAAGAGGSGHGADARTAGAPARKLAPPAPWPWAGLA